MKKMIFAVIALSMVACSNKKDPSPVTSANPIETQDNKLSDTTAQNTAWLLGNEFCRERGAVVERIAFSTEIVPESDDVTIQWMHKSANESQALEPIGVWQLSGDTLTVKRDSRDAETDAKVFKIAFVKWSNIVIGMTLSSPDEAQEAFVENYEVCGISETLAEQAP